MPNPFPGFAFLLALASHLPRPLLRACMKRAAEPAWELVDQRLRAARDRIRILSEEMRRRDHLAVDKKDAATQTGEKGIDFGCQTRPDQADPVSFLYNEVERLNRCMEHYCFCALVSSSACAVRVLQSFADSGGASKLRRS